MEDKQKEAMRYNLLKGLENWENVDKALEEIEEKNWELRSSCQSGIGKILKSQKAEILQELQKNGSYELGGIFYLNQKQKDKKYLTSLMTQTYTEWTYLPRYGYREFRTSEGNTSEESLDNLISRYK